jgi:hypothetical protein
MAYTKTTWVDEVPASTPIKYSINGDIEGEISASAEIAVVTGITPGTAVNAANLNHAETGIYDAHVAAAAAQATATAAIPKSGFTAAGQILVSTGAGTYTVLDASGNTDKAIVSNGTTWVMSYIGQQFGAVVRRVASQSFTGDGHDPAQFTSVLYDYSSLFTNIGVNNTRITIPVGFAGLYVVVMSASSTRDTTPKYQYAWAKKNGTDYIDMIRPFTEVDGLSNSHLNVTFYEDLVEGDYIELTITPQTTARNCSNITMSAFLIDRGV